MPNALTVAVTAAAGLAVGTYSGQIVLASSGATTTRTIPVTLTITPIEQPSFDSLPGGLSFYMKTGEAGFPNQEIRIRNAGPGTLSWTLTKNTADGNNWLTTSTASGNAPSTTTIGIEKASLPGGGAIAGTYVGHILFTAASGSVSVPIRVVVGDSVFQQQNEISFVKSYGGANPLAQTIAITSTGSNIDFIVETATSTGGNWLSASRAGSSCCYSTPYAVTVSVSPNVALAAGSYTGEVLITTYGRTTTQIIPVTLTVASAGAAYLDNLPGQLSFSIATGASTATTQELPIRNGGPGTLNWAATAKTATTSPWLLLSQPTGTTPTTTTVGIAVANLPNGGFVAGTYTGQIVIQTGTGIVTVPVSVVVGTTILSQVNGIAFTKVAGGADPLPQDVALTNLSGVGDFSILASTSTGGNWLSATSSGQSCCYSTPYAVTAGATPAPELAAGTYTGQIVVTTYGNRMAITIPVTLTVVPAGQPYFDSIAGQVSFVLKKGGSSLPGQSIQLRNGGSGTLSWTASKSTATSADWLTLTAESGTAPSSVGIGINVANLPGAGLIAGTFTGQVNFQSATGSVTVPVSVVVADDALRQVHELAFTKPYGGANPLPQSLTLSSTGAPMSFSVRAMTTAGGQWLGVTYDGSSCCYSTPTVLTVAVSPSPTLAAGTYTGQIVVTTYENRMSITIPVTLTVSQSNQPFFDNLPGAATFFQTPGTTAPPEKELRIRNGGAGTLSWTLTKRTGDNGDWLVVSSTSGTAPSSVIVGVNMANLPGGGVLSGTYTGEITFHSTSGRTTVPVSVTVGADVFVQLPPLTFTRAYGATNPVSQSLSVASTGASLGFAVMASTGTGGGWMTADHNGSSCCYSMPRSIGVSILALPSLAAGVYTGQVTFLSYDRRQSMTVPVYLTITGGLGAVAATAPADGATGMSMTPTLTWSAAANAQNYDVYFGTSPSPPLLGNTTNTTYGPGPLAFGTTYYWRIVAKNGSESASSSLRSFQTAVAGAYPIAADPPQGVAGRQLFTFTSRNPLGANSVFYTQILFSKNGINALNACYISYDPAGNVFYLLGDDMAQWYGLLGGSAATVGNSQCTIHGAASGSTKSGNDLQTKIDISFRQKFSGVKSVYQLSAATGGGESGWQAMGTWSDSGDPKAVQLYSITPSSGTGPSTLFTAVVRDSDGGATVPFVQFVMNSGLSGYNGCYIHYDRGSNVFFLLNDAGTQFLGMFAGSGQVSNSQCTLTGAGSGGSVSGSDLTVTYNLAFSPVFSGQKKVFLQTADSSGIIQSWTQMATWTR